MDINVGRDLLIVLKQGYPRDKIKSMGVRDFRDKTYSVPYSSHIGQEYGTGTATVWIESARVWLCGKSHTPSAVRA